MRAGAGTFHDVKIRRNHQNESQCIAVSFSQNPPYSLVAKVNDSFFCSPLWNPTGPASSGWLSFWQNSWVFGRFSLSFLGKCLEFLGKCREFLRENVKIFTFYSNFLIYLASWLELLGPWVFEVSSKKSLHSSSGFYFGQSFSPLHSPETPVNRVFWVSNRIFVFSDQVLAFLHQEFAFLTSFCARKSNLYLIFTSFWHLMLLKLQPKIEFYTFFKSSFWQKSSFLHFQQIEFLWKCPKIKPAPDEEFFPRGVLGGPYRRFSEVLILVRLTGTSITRNVTSLPPRATDPPAGWRPSVGAELPSRRWPGSSWRSAGASSTSSEGARHALDLVLNLAGFYFCDSVRL